MKKFIFNICKLIFGITIIGIICLFIPDTPRLKSSSIYGKVKKDSLLKYVSSPRIVFVGGSNLAFSIDSSIIKDSLGLNPVNTGIMHTIGLKIMIQNYLENMKPKDIVILAPEYHHFFGDFMNGHESTIYYNSIGKLNPFQDLDFKQLLNVLPYFPKFLFKKLDPREYFGFSRSKYFASYHFDKYGDLKKHWSMNNRPFKSNNEFEKEYNENVIEYIKEFEKKLDNANCELYIIPPSYNLTSGINNKKSVNIVSRKLKNSGLSIIGKHEDYIFIDSLFFNSPYHLNKEGTNKRTLMLINDFKKFRKSKL